MESANQHLECQRFVFSTFSFRFSAWKSKEIFPHNWPQHNDMIVFLLTCTIWTTEKVYPNVESSCVDVFKGGKIAFRSRWVSSLTGSRLGGCWSAWPKCCFLYSQNADKHTKIMNDRRQTRCKHNKQYRLTVHTNPTVLLNRDANHVAYGSLEFRHKLVQLCVFPLSL